MICALCGRDAPNFKNGEPVSSGPVCNWCYETRVRPVALRGMQEKRKATGAWVVRTSDGLTVSASAWWVLHEIVSALEPGLDEEDVCRRAEELAEICNPIPGVHMDTPYGRVEWMSSVFLQSPARLIPVLDDTARTVG